MPLTRSFAPRLAPALLTAGLLLSLAAPAWAATSETCLRRCLATCAEQGRGQDETCLRPCLGDCPVHCGTVGVDCALAKVSSTPAAEGGPAALASRCAEACEVKPECRPSAYDHGPAELSAMTLAPHARQAERRFEPKGRSFSLAAPLDWTMEEQDRLASGGDYELKLTGKGQAVLDYALISVRYVASPHRTAERFLHDMERGAQGLAKAAGNATAVSRGSLSGQEAFRVETRGLRSLIGFEESVPTLVRTVVLPLPTGFFVLVLDTPQAAAERNVQVFEGLARSFRPQVKTRARGPELSAQERAVWADFFRSGGRLGRPDSGRPDLNDSGRYLEHTAQARLVAGRTLAAPALDKPALAELARGCGNGPDPALVRAWDAVRSQHVLVADNIFAPGLGGLGLDVQEEPARAGAASQGRMNGPASQERMAASAEPSTRLGLWGGLANLSRVAFSPDGNTALAYVAHGQTSPGTSHFVLLMRSGKGWTLRCAVQRDMIIY